MTDQQAAKKLKGAPKTIGTHDGSFHVDEALACFMLQRLTHEYKDAQILRTRKPELLETCDIIVDVGAVYDPEIQRFDHHQREFKDTFSPKHQIRLSSAGLIYKHFGKSIISRLLGTNEEQTEALFQKVYEAFIKEIDAVDNGVEQIPPEVGFTPPFRYTTHLSARVAHFNPRWNDPEPPNPDDQFRKAMDYAGAAFLDAVEHYGKSWLPGRVLVEEALTKRTKFHSTGEVLVLERYCPWTDHLNTIEEEQSLQPLTKYVVFPDVSGNWRIQGVPLKPGSFLLRKPLPQAWRGLRDADLTKVSGIAGCIFVHASGFIGGNNTFDGALEMAVKALEIAE